MIHGNLNTFLVFTLPNMSAAQALPWDQAHMIVQTVIRQAKDFMSSIDLVGWLLYDYRGINPIFWDIVGNVSHVTRPCWLWIPVHGKPRLLVSFVDQGRFSHLGIETTLFVNRQDMSYKLMQILRGRWHHGDGTWAGC